MQRVQRVQRVQGRALLIHLRLPLLLLLLLERARGGARLHLLNLLRRLRHLRLLRLARGDARRRLLGHLGLHLGDLRLLLRLQLGLVAPDALLARRRRRRAVLRRLLALRRVLIALSLDGSQRGVAPVLDG